MTQNFFALCHANHGLEVKRIRVNGTLQTELVQLFNTQEQAFMRGVSGEVEFDGDWKPDGHEMLVISNLPDAPTLAQYITNNALSVPDLDLANFSNEPIKAIFTGTTTRGVVKILMQRFTARQILSKKLVLLLQNNHFGKLTDPTFTLEEGLVCIIEGTKLKFRSFFNVKAIFDLKSFYQAATDDDIDDFFDQTSPLAVADLPVFKQNIADQGTRKLIHSIITKRNLAQYTVQDIELSARDMGVTLAINNGKIELPADRQEVKKILHLLDDGFYEAPLSGRKYITNSKQPIT